MTSPSQEYRTIPLTQGQVAKVSPHRHEELSKFKWCARWSKKTRSYYAMRNAIVQGKMRIVLMHRQILGLTYGDKQQGDHEDRNTLNNIDSNLRRATNGQNQHNRGKRPDNGSGFKGVSPHGNMFRARITSNGTIVNLGTRTTAEAAYLELYIPAALRYHGEFAPAEVRDRVI